MIARAFVAFAACVCLLQAQSPGPLDAIAKDAEAGIYGNVDALLVIKDGRTVIDRAFTRDYKAISRGRVSDIGCGEGCADAAWMHEFNYLHPDFHPYYKGRGVHTLQSVTKSIAATVIGIAAARGDLGPAGLDRPIVDFFKGHTYPDPRLSKATLRDLLTMRSGIEWHEQDRPLNDTNTTVQLEKSRDWMAFTLAQPMDSDPGTKWAYNSGGSALMAGVIHAATGRHIDDYAREHLFAPLGIRDFHWKKTPTGHPDTEGGLYLSARDLAKIGELYLNGGRWNGRAVLPEAWVKEATTAHVNNVAAGWNYGYQWWLTSRNAPNGAGNAPNGAGNIQIWAGRGFGGQQLLVIPSRRIVAVVTAWNIFGGQARGIFGPLVDALLAL